MPDVTLPSGEKKKVACGPCIRGHRSSKCQHKDRVLIEVRKPGRPLSACPHVPGSCGCERAVVYTVPKSSECPCPTTTSVFNPAAAIAAARVQKPKVRRSLSSSVTPSTIQRAMDGDPLILAQQANSLDGLTQMSSETSSTVSSLVSSSSSTPRIDAVDAGGMQRNDSVQLPIQVEIKEENKPRLQLGMMGIGGYGASSDTVVWGGEWPDANSQKPSQQESTDKETVSSCCKPAVIPEEPVELEPPPSSCCAPKPADSFKVPGQLHQPSLQTNGTQIKSGMRGNGLFNRPTMNFGINFADPFSPTDVRYGQFPPGPNFDFFTQYEGRHGCGTNGQISSHINGSVELHDCQCGDGCLCLGCSQHPANKTTTEYVRFHNQFHSQLAMNGYNTQHSRVSFPGLSSLSYGQTPSQYDQRMHSGSISDLHQNQFAPRFQTAYNPHQGYGLSQGIPTQMAPPIQMLTPTNELQQFHLHSPIGSSTPATNGDFQFQNAFQSPSYQDHSDSQRPPSSLSAVTMSPGLDPEAAMSHDSPSTDQDDSASTLSPSSFYYQQLTLVGCDGETGTCHCGDGCTCDGCLVHNGHANDVTNERSVDTALRMTEALEESGLTQTHELHEFGLNGLHVGFHDSMFPTSVPG